MSSGYGFKKQVWTEEKLKKMEELYMQGLSPPKIGRQFNCSGETVRRKLKEYGTI